MGRRYSGAQTTKGRSAFDLPQGFPTVAKPELGTKRLCASCGAKFYDLNHDTITCPKCGAVHEVAPVPQRGGGPDVPARPVAQEAELPGVVIIVIGIDSGKNSFHIVGLDDRGAMVLRQKWSRTQVETRLANVPRT